MPWGIPRLAVYNSPVILALLLLGAASIPQDSETAAAAVRRLIAKGEYAAALAAARQLAARPEAAADARVEGRALLLEADVLYYLGRRQQMARLYERALERFRSVDDARGMGEAYYDLAYVHELTDPQAMVPLLERALTLARRAGDGRLEKNALNGLGQAYSSLGRLDEAIQTFVRAGAIARELKDERGAAVVLINIGATEFDRGDHEACLRHLLAARAAVERLDSPPLLADVLGNLGHVYWALGDFDRALDHFERSLVLQERIGSPRGQVTQLEALATLQEELGEHARAEVLALRGLRLAAESEDAQGEAILIWRLARTLRSAGRAADAERYLLEAHGRAQRLGDPVWVARIAVELARAEVERGDPRQALAWLAAAEATATAAGSLDELADCAALRGQVLEGLGRVGDAVAAWRHAVALREKTGRADDLHVYYGRLALVEEEAGAVTEARRSFEKSLAAMERLDGRIVFDRFRLSLFRGGAEYYKAFALFLVRQGEMAGAWEVLETGRARDLRLRLAQARGPSILVTAEREALARVSSLQRRLREEAFEAPARQRLLAEVAEAEEAYDRARRRASDGRPAGAAAVPSWFPPAAVTVAYAASGDELVVLSQRGGTVHARVVTGAKALLERARRFSEQASDAAGAFPRADAAALYEALLGEELAGLREGRLVLIPDDTLHQLPFAGLVGPDGSYLAERFALSEAPSLGTLREIGLRPPDPQARGVLVVANTRFDETRGSGAPLPPLPAAAEEAARIARTVADTVVRADASETEIKRMRLRQFQVLHFASHARADEARPERSSIVLGPSAEDDGFLQAREIYRMELACRLAVVSSCRSAGGQAVAGEGLMGLSHALLGAGARGVVLSLWDVSDEGAAELMGRFYEALPGRSAAVALQDAQRGMLRSSRFGHPAHWAAFIAAGDAELPIPIARRRAPWEARLALGALALALAARSWPTAAAARRRGARDASR